YWNTYYLNLALQEFIEVRPQLDLEAVERITPLAYDHIRILGRYSFTLHRAVQDGQARPLKPFPADI
ncbi:MAG: Tn3 family transposase, partial [Phototrophicaceae bacterium]